MTKPIIEYYNKLNQCVTIDADGDVETVYGRVLEQINQRILDI